DGYSDYIYWGLPLFSYPIIITELDVPAVINLGESPGISATAYNINTYQWQHSTNGVSWSNVDESWAPTTAGTHYLRLKTANDDFTAYSGTASIQVIPQKAIVTFEAVTPTSIALNGDVTFIGSITLIGSDTLTSYTWNFGDGTSDSSTLAPTHTYTSAGTYTVTLTVVTAAGTTISTRTNYITVSAQPEFVKFDNTTYTAGDTATVSWNLLNTNFADHEYTIRIFRLDKLGQAFDALTPVPISSSSGSDTFDTTTWSGNYSVYIYQDSYIFREPTDIATVISIHDLQLLITNSGVTWENYTLLTISDGISTIAEGNTSTGTYTFNLQTGTYTITATTDGKTPISTTIYLSSNDIITFDWVTGASKGTTTGAGSAYASTFITFRVLDAKYGLPISGVTITTQGVAATNPFEWFANLFGTAWGATILGTNQTGITDDSGAITFAMFSGVRYIINIDHPILDDPITRTFTPSSLATEYPIYLDIADPDTPDVTTSVATAVTANISGQIIASYSDTSLTTTSIRMEIFEKGLDGNYTLLDQISAYGNASTHAFQLTNFQGKNVKIIITGQTGAFGTVERIYYHTFPGPAVTLGNLPASAYIWICLISAILLGGVATYISSYAAAFVIVFVEWIYWFFGWFFEIGAIPAATLLTVATVIAVAAYMASRR
ncbi:MAG: PKD domain-containing protein, partial [Candidatus Pacebacteria bacterium]|nr:PKD domain-containing protein [Candidatus Paceibacterota bacterium]